MYERETIYCDDLSHAAEPVGAYIEGPDIPSLPHDVFVVAQFRRLGDPPVWVPRPWAVLADRFVRVRDIPTSAAAELAGLRSLDQFGDVARRFTTIRATLLAGAEPRDWTPACGRCPRRGGTWTPEHRDALLTRAADRGIVGVSVTALAALRHAD